MKIFLQQDGSQTGPFDDSAILERLNQGTLTPEVYAWREGMSDWRPLGEVLLAASTPDEPASVDRAVVSVPSVTHLPMVAASAVQNSKMPWWGKLLLGCGGLVALGMISLAGVIAYALHQEQMGHGGGAAKAGTDWAKFDKEMAEMREKGDQERADIQKEIERATADAEHYTTSKTNDPDGSTTTTITPKTNAPGDKPITKRVDADGKTTTTTVDADGNTVIRTEDKNGNVSTVTNPKQR